MEPSVRKPHRDFAGYVCELRNYWSGGHTVISDCKRASDQGMPLVADYEAEGGRYQVLCNDHGHLVYTTNMPVARECMKAPTNFCMVCRAISPDRTEDWERGLTAGEVTVVRLRQEATR